MPDYRKLKDADYIGDGLYVGHDGYHVWLTAPTTEGHQQVALEPYVLKQFQNWVERHIKNEAV